MVVMVGGKIVPDGSNYNLMSEEKQEVDSVQEVEAEVIDDDDGNDFSNFVENQLPMEINREEHSPPTATAKLDPPATHSPAVAAAKAAVAAAVANIGGNATAVATAAAAAAASNDDGGGKPAAKKTRVPMAKRTTIDADKDAKWLATVDLLKEFKRLNGHCNGKTASANGL